MLSGLDLERELKDVFSLAIAQSNRAADNANIKGLKGIISFDTELSPEAAQSTQKQLKDKLEAAILDGGAKYQQLAPTAAENQLLQSRRLSIEDIARVFGIHPLLLAHDAAGQSLTRIDDVMRYHIKVTLAPWVNRWEQALEFCFSKSGEFIALDESKFWRMAPEDRASFAAKASGSGGGAPWMTQNEARELFSLNPIEGGDTLQDPDPFGGEGGLDVD